MAAIERDLDLIGHIDNAPLTARYWATFALIVSQLVCELFDFFVVGFLVSAVAPSWGLTFGQSTIMLLSAGVGAMVGALGFGWIADRIGRKPVVVTTALICGVCAGSVAFVPEGGWILFSLLRFLVGVGYGGAGASQFALVTEYTPAPRRTLLTSSMAIPAGIGLLLASSLVSTLFPVLGWRGVAALGFIPIILVIPLAMVIPESAKWLISKGEPERARRAAAKILGIAVAELPLTAPPPSPPRPKASPLQLFGDQRRFWLVVLIQLGLGATLTGVQLWGPTIVAQLMRISTAQAAGYFVAISLTGLFGRIMVAILAQRVGRLPVGKLTAYIGAIMLATAAITHDSLIADIPLFLVCLIVGQAFYDGAFSNVITYAAELYPVRMAGLGMGLSAASGGLGKIIGPLMLGLLAGSSNLVSPKATDAAVLPGFLFLAGCMVVVGLAYSLLGIETHRKPSVIS